MESWLSVPTMSEIPLLILALIQISCTLGMNHSLWGGGGGVGHRFFTYFFEPVHMHGGLLCITFCMYVLPS